MHFQAQPFTKHVCMKIQRTDVRIRQNFVVVRDHDVTRITKHIDRTPRNDDEAVQVQDHGLDRRQFVQPRLADGNLEIVIEHRTEPVGPCSRVPQYEDRPSSIGRKTADPNGRPVASSLAKVRERYSRELHFRAPF